MKLIHRYRKHGIVRKGLSVGWDKGPAIILYFPIGTLESDVYLTESSFDRYMGKALKMLRIYIYWGAFWRPIIKHWDTFRYPIGEQRHIPGDGWKKCGKCGKIKYYHNNDNLNCPDSEVAKAFHEQGKKDMKEHEDTGKPKITIRDANEFYLETVFEVVNG